MAASGRVVIYPKHRPEPDLEQIVLAVLVTIDRQVAPPPPADVDERRSA